MATQAQPQPHEASPPTSLTIYDVDLAHALDALRATPAAELSAIRTLRIVLTADNIIRWHGSVWPGIETFLYVGEMEELERLHPVPASIPAGNPPSKAFRALLRFVAETFDLGNLELEVDPGVASWGLFADSGAAAYATQEEEDVDWRFIYEIYMDVGRALAEELGDGNLRRLRGLKVRTMIWDGVGPWLMERLRGSGGTVVTKGLPRFHDAGMQLLPDQGGDVKHGDEVEAD